MPARNDFENEPETAEPSASSPPEAKSANFQIERPDWRLFGSLGSLGQKAGVPATKLRRLCLKELVDNDLDAGARATIEQPKPGHYSITDDGHGIDGTPEDIARLFSIDRPLVSSKLWRKSQRGALGNGLRVVAGALIASGGGMLRLWTRNQCLSITPLEDGGASVYQSRVAVYSPTGTHIEISFGPLLPQDDDATLWAKQAIVMAKGGAGFDGKSSPHWFDADAFYELVQGAGKRPVRQLIENLDGCTGAKASEVASHFLQRSCGSLTREDSTALLQRARALTTPPSVKRLGMVGSIDELPAHVARQEGEAKLSAREPLARIPYVVEAWAETAKESEIEVYVNRTQITGEATVYFDSDKDFMIYGCGLSHVVKTPAKKGAWRLALNITAPFVPITTDGKEPDLDVFAQSIVAALSAAIKKAHRNAPKKGALPTQKEAVIANLEAAIAKTSGEGQYRFAQRQLLYALRPIVMAETGKELKTENFNKIITDYEAEYGDIPDMYRDNRGALYQPHSGEGDIAVGTLMVEGYVRPPWSFNKILYIEKQGFFETLKAEQWPEQHDCALLTGKGYTTRAIRDRVDHLAEHDEPAQFFCVHDADSAGSMIMQTLQEATRARGARLVEIVNFGLEPWEAEAMGLEAEEFKQGEQQRPVADYVLQHEDGAAWSEWLQSKRYELNAMTTPQFLNWLEAKMMAHAEGKVIPPKTVLAEQAFDRLDAELRRRITERVLREADIEGQVAAARASVKLPGELTPKAIEAWLDARPLQSWRECIDETVNLTLCDREF